MNIIDALDDIGITYIEAGNPASNPKDAELFSRLAGKTVKTSVITAFGSTRRKDTDVSSDPDMKMLSECSASTVCIFGKSSSYHVRSILQTTCSENLRMIEQSVSFLKQSGKNVIFDAEHFFDGMKSDPEYAVETLKAAKRGGADIITLCDTNGGSFPKEIGMFTSKAAAAVSGCVIGIHAHNDIGLAAACTIAAAEAGARMVQGTFIGTGERTGNANLSTLIPILQLRLGYSCIDKDKMQHLTKTAIKIAEISNVSLHKNLPFVGRNAFTHKAGMHADAVAKDPYSIELIDPQSVGNKRHIPVSEMMGHASMFDRASRLYPDIDRTSPALENLIREIKEKEKRGYHFEGADGSIDLLIKRCVEGYEPFFELVTYCVKDIYPGHGGMTAEAEITIKVKGKKKKATGTGNGPVNALDTALRKALSGEYPCLKSVYLTDFKVRVLESNDATASTVRVLITSTDGRDVWTTIGVSEDIIEAGFIALSDSVEYKLLKRDDENADDGKSENPGGQSRS